MPKVLINLMTMLKMDSTILDNMVLPFTGNDRDTCITNMIRETMPLSVSVTDPAILKWEIAAWSCKRLPVWTRLYKTLDLRYDPISNYNRTEEWVDRADDRMRNVTSGTADHNENGTTTGENTGKTTSTDSGTDKSTTNAKQTGTVKNDGTNTRTTDTTEHGTNLLQVQAFNQSEMADSEKTTTDQTQNVKENGGANTTETTDMGVITTVDGSSGGTSTTDTNGTENGTSTGHSDDTSNGTNDTDSVHFSSHKGKMYGNIGVTTTQHMIEEERSVALFDIFSVIINDFKAEFCILIY